MKSLEDVDALINNMRAKGIACEDCLRSARRTLEERLAVVQCSASYEGFVDSEYLQVAGLYQRCFELSDRHVEVEFGLINDIPHIVIEAKVIGETYRMCASIYAEDGTPHYPPRLIGAALMLCHQTLATACGVLPKGLHEQHSRGQA